MATLTLGTNANSSLTALQFKRGGLSNADFATMVAGIKYDSGPRIGTTVPGGCTRSGLLIIPQRGVIQMLPGDYFAFDSTTGWPILVSAKAIASGPWTHS